MGTGKYFVQNHIKSFREEIHKTSKISKTVFFNWFNESGGRFRK